MDKFAQKRSLLNKMWEKANISGISAEKFFNPEFKKVMEDLRLKDDNIRSVVAGESIGQGDVGKDSISLKQLLKSCKSDFNRREYMSAIASLGRFHAKLFEIQDWIKQLDGTVNEVHHEFLFKDLDDDKKKYLHEMKSRLASERNNELIKQAGLMDFFYNIGTKRGRALAAWEKRYPKQTAKLKKDTSNLLSKSEGILSQILSALKEMSSARANRNVDAYMKAAEKITKFYISYDASFRVYYNENVKSFLEKIELIPAETKPEISPSAESIKTPTSPTIPFDLINKKEPLPINTEVPKSPPHMSTMPPSGPAHVEIPKPAKTPDINFPANDVTPDKMTPEEMKVFEQQHGISTESHRKFYNSLKSLSNESPIILSNFISKYAKSIESEDPFTSIQLLKIVKSIKG